MTVPADLLAIAARAAPLEERRRGPFVPLNGAANTALSHARHDRWVARLGGDEALLARRLALAGWPGELAKKSLANGELPAGGLTPPWLKILEDVMGAAPGFAEMTASTDNAPENAAGSTHSQVKLTARGTEHPAPADQPPGQFQLFARPWLEIARLRLRTNCPRWADRVSPRAIADAEASLVRRVLQAAGESLEIEYAIFQALHATTGSPWLAGPGSPARSQKQPTGKFLPALLATGLPAFFTQYPALARHLSRSVERWVNALTLLERDWMDDTAELERCFNHGRPLGQLAAISLNLADAHAGGRSVVVLTFAGDVRIVYKPRSCAMEQALFDLQAWCAARDPALEFKPVQVLDRGAHGWMEFVPARDCADAAEVRRHFRSSGRLLGLAYALAGSDFHLENLIAHGPHAVAVDAELLVVPTAPDIPGNGSVAASIRAGSAFVESVWGTHLLPRWDPGRSGQAHNIGGLGTGRSTASHPSHPPANIPRLNGQPVACDHHVHEIVGGFAQIYEFMLAQRAALLADDGPIAGWRDHPLRFVHRATAIYGQLLQAAGHASCLEDGTLRSIEFEQLYRALGATLASRSIFTQRLVAAEVAALEDGDVPFFQTRAGSRDLPLPDGTVLRDYFERSGIEHARDRLTQLSPTDLAQQCATIRASFHLSRAVDTSHRRVCASVTTPDASAAATDPALLSAVHEIVRSLWASATRVEGTATWIGPQLLPATERYHVLPLGAGLYDGLAGVALFLTAAAQITGNAAARQLADETRATLCGALRGRTAGRDLTRAGLGLASGIGGPLYALTHCAALRNDSALLGAAAEVAALITPEAIAADRTLDVLGGGAGAILALLAYHATTRQADALETARRIGEQLLIRREVTPTGQRSWRFDGSFLTGFSHGAAGIACALLRLHAATGETAFKAAAEEALAFETARFDAAEGNWPDLRPHTMQDGRAGFMTTWCHGGPGIAVGRLATLDVLDTPAVRVDIAAGLAIAQQHGETGIDHCCCGNLGRAEILDFAGLRLGDEALRRQARQVAGAVLARARAEGGYGCFRELPRSLQSPGFFQGLSGIGYALLRLVAPGRLPCVLAFERPRTSASTTSPLGPLSPRGPQNERNPS